MLYNTLCMHRLKAFWNRQIHSQVRENVEDSAVAGGMVLFTWDLMSFEKLISSCRQKLSLRRHKLFLLLSPLVDL